MICGLGKISKYLYHLLTANAIPLHTREAKYTYKYFTQMMKPGTSKTLLCVKIRYLTT